MPVRMEPTQEWRTFVGWAVYVSLTCIPSAMAPQTAFPKMTWPQKLVWMTETNTCSGIHLCESYVCGKLTEFYMYIYIIYIYTHHLYTNWIEAIWMIYISYILKPNFGCEIDVAHPTSVLPGSLEPPGQPHTPRVKCKFTDSPGQNRLVTLQKLTSPRLKDTFEDDFPLVGYVENPLRVYGNGW